MMDSGATSGVPTSSWICACLRSGIRRGSPSQNLPLKIAVTCPCAGPTWFAGQRLPPKIEELAKGVRPLDGAFDVNDSVSGVGVQPGKATSLSHERPNFGVLAAERWADTDPVRNYARLAVDENDEMCVDVKHHPLHCLALDPVDTLGRSCTGRRRGQYRRFGNRRELRAQHADGRCRLKVPEYRKRLERHRSPRRRCGIRTLKPDHDSKD